jgi:hypothetical protein
MSAPYVEESWPFAGVFLRERPRTDDDDGPQPPDVRGLGFAIGRLVVTLEHVPERAELFASGGARLPVTAATVHEWGPFAYLDWSERLSSVAELSEPFPGQRCQVAVVRDDDPSIRIRTGAIGDLRPDRTFPVELDGVLQEYETASGSPVVMDGNVVGIVGPTATNRSLDAFSMDQVMRRADPDDTQLLELSESAAMALTYGLAILGPGQTAGGAVVLGAMRYAAETMRSVAVPLVRMAVERSGNPDSAALGVDELIERLGNPVPEFPHEPLSTTELAQSRLGALVGAAVELAMRYGGAPEVHLRHVLVAAVMQSPLPPALFEELGTTPEGLRDTLRGAIEGATPDGPDLARSLVLDSFELAGGISEDLVDPTEARELSEDHLGVRDYVTMFATLIAHKDTPMPLSIGLFGEWGSGKSYFMALLRGEVDRLSQSGDARYRREIRQIGFNAWTYADSNLWASLGDEIFAQLAGPGETDADRRARLQSDLNKGFQRRRELEGATEHAKEETARLTQEVEATATERGVLGRALTQAAAGEALDALKRLGVDDEVEQGRLLADELRGAPTDVDVIRRSLTGGRGIALAIGAALTVAAIVVGLAASWDWLAGLGGVAFVTVVGAAGWVLARLRSGLGVLHRVGTRVRAEAAKDEKVQEQLAELKQAEAQERVLQAQLDEVVAQVGELGRELAELNPGQRLYTFVAERAASDEYRRQLGLISTIRKDLKELVRLMGEWEKDPQAPAPIERIVLYIDDLDRCSPEQVVEVLQAVHLLLALELFVVVVGVDPRWLLRALRGEYRAMLTGKATAPDEDEWWQTTPQDYLEKIFNIPFALPRMSTSSFDLLVRSLASPRVEETTQEALHREADAVAAAAAQVDEEAPEPESRQEAPPVLAAEAESEVAALQRGEAPPVETRPLSEPELRLLSSLAPLVETPREAKRMLNLYRMIRSTRNLSPAARFLGSEDRPGDYQAVVILLGLLSGHARRLEDVLVAAPGEGCAGGLRHRDSSESWADFVAGMKPRQNGAVWKNAIVGARAEDDLAGWQRLAEGLAPATKLVKIGDLEPFQRWAPLIARFSFLLSPYAGHEEEAR